MSRLDGLGVYARPKADLLKDAATPPEVDADAAARGDLISNLALAAVTLPGHLRAAKTAQTCSVYVLSQGLLTLTTLQRCLAGEWLQLGHLSPLAGMSKGHTEVLQSVVLNSMCMALFHVCTRCSPR